MDHHRVVDGVISQSAVAGETVRIVEIDEFAAVRASKQFHRLVPQLALARFGPVENVARRSRFHLAIGFEKAIQS